jgi:hypothetical protein
VALKVTDEEINKTKTHGIMVFAAFGLNSRVH